MCEFVSASEPKPKLVFVVDDEQVIATTLAIILNKAGFDAHALFQRPRGGGFIRQAPT
jgi:FixJ family two-component response regulator